MEDNRKDTAVKAPKSVGTTPVPTKASEEADGRIDRIVHETRQLGDDLMEWVNLRLRLVQLDVQERIDQELDFVFSGAVVLALIAIALLMATFGLAFILGDRLGKPWYGFAIMAIVYVVAAVVISKIRPRLAAGFRSTWVKERLERHDDPSKTDQ